MGSKTKILLSLNLLLHFLLSTCDNSSSPSGNGAYVAPNGGGAYVAPCPQNSSSSGGGGSVYMAPCPHNSSLSCLTPPSGSTGGASVAPCPCNSSSLSCPTPSNNGGVYVAPCPRDALKLGICANLLGKSIGVEVGNSTITPCCALVAGLVDLEVAVCFCTAIKANILGIKLDVPISLSLPLNFCGINPSIGFVCA